MIRPEYWDGNSLDGEWLCTIKIDGIRAQSDGLHVTSRRGKPLFNLDHLASTFTDAEIFMGSFKETVHAIRTQGTVSEMPEPYNVYSLDPLDKRLYICTLVNPIAAQITDLFKSVRRDGHEGLVLRQGDKWVKVVDEVHYDVPIIGVIEGKGRNVGRLGAFITPMGKVGTGFTDEEREAYFAKHMIGETIEVACKELTSDGKFRHPRFVRDRWDK